MALILGPVILHERLTDHLTQREIYKSHFSQHMIDD